MRVEEIVGQRIRDRRERLELTQEQLGQRIGEMLGRDWPRQAVSAAENGKRAFTAAELLAIAYVLGMTVDRLLTPPLRVKTIELAEGAELPRGAVYGPPLDPNSLGQALDDMMQAVVQLGEQQKIIAGAAGVAGEDIKKLRENIWLQSYNRIPEQVTEKWPDAEKWLAPLDTPQPVVAAIVTSSKGVLVGKRNDGKPPWTFIAGEIEPRESPGDAAVREVKEEAGLLVRAGDIIGQRVHPKTGRTMIYIATAPTHGTEVFVGDADELTEVRWATLAEADELLPGMFEPVREYLAYELGAGDQEP